MRVLHCCSYYFSSSVYSKLFKYLEVLGVEQDIFILAKKSDNRNQELLKSKSIRYEIQKSLFLDIFKWFYFFKLVFHFFHLCGFYLSELRGRGCNLVHAHTLYSDGVCAFFLSLIFNLKLVLTVRNTDVNLYFKFLPHYKWLLKLVLNRAHRLVFISHSHKDKFRAYFGGEFDDKIFVLHNGVDDFYIKESVTEKVRENIVNNAVYIGSFDSNKNVKSIVDAFSKSECLDGTLFLIGGRRSDYEKVYGDIGGATSSVKFLGRLDNKQILNVLDDSALFIMPSFRETFGLVYLEAISRCIPIVYTQNEGFDGVISEGVVGYSCDPYDVDSITSAINKTVKKFPSGLIFREKNIVQDFSWEKISKKYVSFIYE